MRISTWQITLLILVLLWSLHSHYSYQLGLPLLSTLSGLIIFLAYCINNYKSPALYINKLQITLISFYLLNLGWSLLDMIFLQSTPDIKRVAFISLSFLFICGSRYLLDTVKLRHILMFYLLVHSSCLYLQFFVFHFLDFQIDFLKPFTGVNQSVFGGKFQHNGDFLNGFIRSAGLYNEPGTYSNFIAPCIMLLARYFNDHIAYKVVFLLSLFSLVLSFSIFGLVFSLIIILFIPYIKTYIKILLFSSIGSITVPYLIWRFIEKNGGNGIEIRLYYLLNSFDYIFNNVHGLFF